MREEMAKKKSLGDNLREAIALMQKNTTSSMKEGMTLEDLQQIERMQKFIIQKMALI